MTQFASRSYKRDELLYSTFLPLDAGQNSVEAVEHNFFPLGVGVSTLASLHTSLCMLLVSSRVVEVRWSIMREKGQGIGKRYNEDLLYRDSFWDASRLLESTENLYWSKLKLIPCTATSHRISVYRSSNVISICCSKGQGSKLRCRVFDRAGPQSSYPIKEKHFQFPCNLIFIKASSLIKNYLDSPPYQPRPQGFSYRSQGFPPRHQGFPLRPQGFSLGEPLGTSLPSLHKCRVDTLL